MIATTHGGVKARQKPPGLALNLCVLRTYFAALCRSRALEYENNVRNFSSFVLNRAVRLGCHVLNSPRISRNVQQTRSNRKQFQVAPSHG
jgi:hypothetical protein